MSKRTHFSSSCCSLYVSKHHMTSGQKLLWCSECEVRGDSVISHSCWHLVFLSSSGGGGSGLKALLVTQRWNKYKRHTRSFENLCLNHVVTSGRKNGKGSSSYPSERLLLDHRSIRVVICLWTKGNTRSTEYVAVVVTLENCVVEAPVWNPRAATVIRDMFLVPLPIWCRGRTALSTSLGSPQFITPHSSYRSTLY